MLNFEPGLTIWSLITFFILAILLWKTAWPQILKALDERESKIRSSLADAEKAREAADGMQKEYEKMMDKARKEALGIIKQGQEKADKIREDLIVKAKDDATALVEKAKKEISLEREKALSDMKEKAINLSVAISAKIITSTLDKEKQRELAEQAIKEMESR